MESMIVIIILLMGLIGINGGPTEDVLKLVKSINDTLHAQGNLSGIMVTDLIGSLIASLFVLGHILVGFYRFWTRAPTGE